MKPLVVIDARTVVGQFTGIGRYALSLIPELLALRPDWRFHVFVAPGARALFGEPPGDVVFEEAPPVPRHPASDWWLHVTLPRWLAQRRASVFFSAANYLPVTSGGARRVVTIHDMVPYTFPGTDPLKFVLYLRAHLRLCGWVADAIIAVSRNTAREVTEILGVPPDRVHVVYNGVTPQFRRLGDEELRALVNARPALAQLPRGFALSIGTHTPRKNFTRLIAAMARLERDRLLVLAGPADRALQTARAQARSLGVEHRVRFVDYPDDDGLVALYNLTSLFVYPSLYEGFGIPIAEAMACGAPVASSNSSCLPEVCGQAAVMFDPTDEQQMADAIERVLSDPELAARLGAAGPAQAAQFSWPKAARETAAVIERLL